MNQTTFKLNQIKIKDIYKNRLNESSLIYKMDIVVENNREVKAKLEEDVREYIEEQIPNLEVNVHVKQNTLYVYRAEKFVTKSTLLSVWGDKLFDKYIDDNPDVIQKIKVHGKSVRMWLISMDRVRRIEKDSSFRKDWKKWKRKSFEDRFQGLENTNYKEL